MRATWVWICSAAALWASSASLYGCAGKEFTATAGTGGATPTSSGGHGGHGGDGGGGEGAQGGGGGTPAPCGNGAIDYALGEQCDDGNATDGDGCSAACLIEPPITCGDGVVDYQNGEQCDDLNDADGDGCSAACLIEPTDECGDGMLDPAAGEQCDDGNTLGGDGCSPACHYETVGKKCGNGLLDVNEACDDSNDDNGDACNVTCNLKNVVTTFAGAPGDTDSVDGIGSAARFIGQIVLAANANRLYLGETWSGFGTDPIPSYRIRMVEIATAAVTTIAGGPAMGNVDAADGLSARFGAIGAVATDGATLWIADEGNRTLRAMELSPPYAVTTVAGGAPDYQDGTGSQAGFSSIRGLTYYGGYVYLVDSTKFTLRRFDPVSTEVVTLAGMPGVAGSADGTGDMARFQGPLFMTSDGSGVLYISDTNGYTIRTYNTVTQYVGTFAGSGTPAYTDGIGLLAGLHRARGITTDGTSLYFVEYSAHTVRQGVLATQAVSTLAGTAAPGGAGGYQDDTGIAALFAFPSGIAFHYPTRSLFVYDASNAVIRRIQ